jgi:hypothetical protein
LPKLALDLGELLFKFSGLVDMSLTLFDKTLVFGRLCACCCALVNGMG